MEYIYIRITENASSTLADGEFFNRAFAVWKIPFVVYYGVLDDRILLFSTLRVNNKT